MWHDLSSFIISYLDPIGVVVGLLLAVPVIWSWGILLGNRRRQREIIKNIQNTTGDRPMALVVSVGTGEVTSQVAAYLHDNKLEMEIKSLCFSALTKDKVSDFVTTLRKVRAELMEKGVGKVHLFYFGPVIGALLVGDVFSNGAVSIYYFHRDKAAYECWGPLTHPMGF